MYTTKIHVRYPHPGAEIVLLGQPDWDTEIPPISSNEADGTSTFEVSSDNVFLYYKPCLKYAGERHFSRGSNYLALMPADEQEIFPHFFEASGGRITDVENMQCVSEADRCHAVRVYLPPGYYENSLRRYPVLYMHDGHNLFFPEEAFTGQTWEVERAIQLLDSMNIIDPVIVVAIYPRDRMHEYTYPGYEAYGRFVVETVKPTVDAKYRTLPTPAETALMGSSLGGVVSLYMAWEYPHVFGKAACLSSTFTWKDDLMRRVTDEERRPVRIYLDSGWPGDNFEVTRAMFDLLQRQGYEIGRELMYLAFPEASHSEADWATRLHIPFQFLFARYAQQAMKEVAKKKRQPVPS